MLYYIMLCYVLMLCSYVMFCCIMVCYIILYYVMLCYVICIIFYQAFSKNFKNTITTKQSNMMNTIGSRQELSFYDVKMANLHYCNGMCCIVYGKCILAFKTRWQTSITAVVCAVLCTVNVY